MKICVRCNKIAEDNSVFCAEHNQEVSERLQALDEVIRKNKLPPCKDCGALTIKEAHHLCKRKRQSDSCHGCEIWQPKI
jgi:RNA polymerase subunit RPABC4/transcription elongation factor Spt4